VLDPILVDAATGAGAEVVFGQAVVDLLFDDAGRVCGVRTSGPDRSVHEIHSDLVVGADGIRSRVARVLEVETDYTAPHAACSIYGYWPDVPLEGYHWYYSPGVSIGTIPTNDDATCVFALIPQSRFVERRHEGVDTLHNEALATVDPELADRVATTDPVGKLRAFAGQAGHLRRSTGPGWALVGDAGYFRDPITAHGITDALREAELLARAISDDDGAGLETYQMERDARVRGLLDVTDRIASFDWGVQQVQEDHLELNRQMNLQVEIQRALGC
jgi:flavin-dependent dehydrogenase